MNHTTKKTPTRLSTITRTVLVFCGSCAATSLPHADELTNLLTGKSGEPQITPDKVISTENSTQDDSRIGQRLRKIFSELEALRNIHIVVNSGVVTLQGEDDTTTNKTKAVQVARQIEGVVEVENELTINRDLAQRLTTTWDKILALGKQIVAALPLLLLALMVFLLFWWMGGRIARRQGFYRRISPNYFIASLLGQITHLVFIVSGVVLALVLLDATALIGTILGAAGIVGLAVGFAVRDTVENYIASILLSVRNPFEVNDFVNIDGHEGNVVRLTSRATVLLSPDGNHIRIPNAAVFKAVITNFTRHSDRRFQFDVGIDTEQDLLVAQALALEILKSVTGVLDDPKPMVVIQALGGSNVVLRLFAWVDQRYFSLAKVRGEAIRAVKTAFDNAGIVMPEPIYRLRLTSTGVALHEPEPAPEFQEPTGVADHRLPDTRDVEDVSADRTIEDKVKAEETSGDGENLLNADTSKEL